MRRLRSVRWITGRVRECRCERAFLTSLKKAKPRITALIHASGLNVIKSLGHQFSGRGYTCVWLLKQSHVSVHSWPEHGFVTITIEVCDFEGDPGGRAERLHRSLLRLFRSAKTSKR